MSYADALRKFAEKRATSGQEESSSMRKAKQGVRRKLAARFLEAQIRHRGLDDTKSIVDTALFLADTLIEKTS